MRVLLEQANSEEASQSLYLHPPRDTLGWGGEFTPDLIPHAVPLRKRGLPGMLSSVALDVAYMIDHRNDYPR